jgi:signal peptidase I
MPAHSARHFSYTEQKTKRTRMLRAVFFVFLVLVGYELLTGLFLKPVIVKSEAMEPGLRLNDRVIVSPILYGLSGQKSPKSGSANIFAPRRGDLVLVAPPYYKALGFPASALDAVIRLATFQRFGYDSRGHERQYGTETVKRVIGLPGDAIKIEKGVASVNPGGVAHFLTEFEVAKESYDITAMKTEANWQADLPFSGSTAEFTLGPDEYFVLNDNRSISNDSRSWGAVSRKRIVGKVVLRYWPLKR